MALIKCPECGRDVSNKAEKCIHCGYPLHQAAAAPQNPGEADSKNRINLDDPGYNSSSPGQVVVQNNKANILWVILGTIAMIAIAVGIVMHNGNKSKNNGNMAPDPNRTSEWCTYWNEEVPVYPSGHDDLCYQDADGYYHVLFGHHHHK